MGFFSKLWKGVKKRFKQIFKPIKKVFKSFGKFMNKLGVAGQIAMMFIPIPGLGALMSGLGSLGSKALGFMTKFGAVGKGAATLIGSAAKFAGAIAKPFVNVTKAVTGFFENVTRFVGSKIPGISGLLDPSKTPTGIFGGTDSAWSRASGAITDSFKDFKGDIASAASMDISDLLPKDVGIDAAGNKIINHKGYDSAISDKNLEKTFGTDSDPYGTKAIQDSIEFEAPPPINIGQTPIEINQNSKNLGLESDHEKPFDPDYFAVGSTEPTPPTGVDTSGSDISVSEGSTWDKFGDEWTDLKNNPIDYGLEKGKDLLKQQLSPTSLLSKVLQSPPEMPESTVASMYIDPVDPYKYRSPTTPTENPYTQTFAESAFQFGGQEEVQANMGFGGAEQSAWTSYINKLYEPSSMSLPIMEKGLSSGWDMEPMGTPRQRAYMAGL